MENKLFGFTVMAPMPYLALHPVEDSFLFDSSRNAVVVADGVTMDALPYSPNRKTVSGSVDFFLTYPSPSPSSIVANIFSKKGIDSLLSEDINEGSISRAFAYANDCVAAYNQLGGFGTHFGRNDFAGCVGSMALVDNLNLYWGYICDSGLAVLDDSLNVKFKTENDGDRDSSRRCNHPLVKGLDRRDSEVRHLIKDLFRNRPKREFSYGVINGEEGAMHYVRSGVFPLSVDDRVLVYSDGAEEVLFDGNSLCDVYSSLIRENKWAEVKNQLRNDVRFEGTFCAIY